MTLDALFRVAGLLALASVVSIALGPWLPLRRVARSTRAEIGRLWGAILLAQAVIVALGAVLGSDPDGSPLSGLAALTIVAVALTSVGLWRARTRVAEDRRQGSGRRVAPEAT